MVTNQTVERFNVHNWYLFQLKRSFVLYKFTEFFFKFHFSFRVIHFFNIHFCLKNWNSRRRNFSCVRAPPPPNATSCGIQNVHYLARTQMGIFNRNSTGLLEVMAQPTKHRQSSILSNSLGGFPREMNYKICHISAKMP